jgi:hypothetical protein
MIERWKFEEKIKEVEIPLDGEQIFKLYDFFRDLLELEKENWLMSNKEEDYNKLKSMVKDIRMIVL